MSDLPSPPPEFKGAADLGSPSVLAARRFAEIAAANQVQAVVMVGLGIGGQVFLLGEAPGGHVQTLGLLAAGEAIIGARMATQMQGGAG